MARVAPGRQLQCRFCERNQPGATEKERLIGGRDGASNRPRRAALEHKGNLTRTRRPRLQLARRKLRLRLRLHREQHPKCQNENPKTQFAAEDSAHFGQRPPRFTSDTSPRQPASCQCSLPSRFTTGLQPSIASIQAPRSCVMPCDGQPIAIVIRPPPVPPVLGRIPGAKS